MASGEVELEANPVFGVLARRLEVRSLAGSWQPRAEANSQADLAFASQALSTAAWAELEARSFLVRPFPDSRGGRDAGYGPLTRIRIGVATLETLAAARPELLALLVAHRNAYRPLGKARVMGIVNVTPDSFSDGGRFLDPERAIEHGRALLDAGADYLDVGGESTRPGAESVPTREELSRVLPVVEALSRGPVPVSIDTQKYEVARRALDCGASLVNDISAGTSDERMLALVAERECDYVCMHMRGTPTDMQTDPRYEDPVREIIRFLRERVYACLKAGVALRTIRVDPGIGFGKRLEDNLALIRSLGELRSLGLPMLLGPSRKSFLSAISGASWSSEKTGETVAASTACILSGADILRVHDVATLVPAVKVAQALAPAPEQSAPVSPESRASSWTDARA